jgi:hypothetical protein
MNANWTPLLQPTLRSGSEKAAPLNEGSDSGKRMESIDVKRMIFGLDLK